MFVTSVQSLRAQEKSSVVLPDTMLHPLRTAPVIASVSHGMESTPTKGHMKKPFHAPALREEAELTQLTRFQSISGRSTQTDGLSGPP